MLPDKIFYPAAAVIAIVLIAISFVWPQGLGAPSPKPFGHAIELPDYYRMVRERDARLAREAKEKEEARAKAAAEAASASAAAQ
ncbi:MULTISPECIES: hypothetical protein [Asticcacaulis]|uniref:hypothetical protein n=1 Tax=Asticcacaulis TaxID=76890 RepID=UPI001FD8E4B4|nr:MULTISPECIES: hypothetical protein [Asticcacaulis]MBP2157512.1 hypothetical protein [Asticcacaulis solisilvae]MDR6798557.1 hypothetical protein [Asticcacaulis sp. BE141]